jgi:hypothetical protein
MGENMSENHELYRQYVDYFYGELEATDNQFEVTKRYVINQLKNNGISKATQGYLQRRKWDRTNDYMLDATDAMQSYSKRRNPNYKHMCAVLLEGQYA